MNLISVPGEGTNAGDLDEPSLRRLGAALATSVEHLGMDVNPEDYAEFLFPFDRPAWRNLAVKTMYTCALGGRGYLLRLGCRDKHLVIPYEHDSGLAVADVLTSCGAWVDATKPGVALPGVGDLVYMDTPQRSNPHIKIMRGWNEDDDALFAPTDRSIATTVDGGQTLKDASGRPVPGQGYRFEPKACFFDRISDRCIMVRSAITPSAPARQMFGYGPITKYKFTVPVGRADAPPASSPPAGDAA